MTSLYENVILNGFGAEEPNDQDGKIECFFTKPEFLFERNNFKCPAITKKSTNK